MGQRVPRLGIERAEAPERFGLRRVRVRVRVGRDTLRAGSAPPVEIHRPASPPLAIRGRNVAGQVR